VRLLFLSVTAPLSINSGFRMRRRALLRAPAAEGHETTLAMFADSGHLEVHTRQLWEVCSQVEEVPLPLAAW
jgi:hypothetical protein